MPAETHSSGGPLGEGDLRALVVDRIGELTGLDPEMVHDHLYLRDDLGIDDVLMIDLAETLELDLGERTVAAVLDDDDLSDIDTVADLVRCVEARCGAAQERAHRRASDDCERR
jgi:Phosphopantetheine attachment site